MYTLIASINSAHCHNTTTNLDMDSSSIWNGNYSFMDCSFMFSPAPGGTDGCASVCFRNIFSIAACWLVVRESVSPPLPWCVKIVTNVSWVWFVRLFGQILSWHVTWQRIMTDITAAIYILWGARERDQHQMTPHSLHQQHSRGCSHGHQPSTTLNQLHQVSSVL